MMTKLLILSGPNPNGFFGFGYKGFTFLNLQLINRKYGQGTHSIKMGAEKSAENTPNAPKLFGPICLPILSNMFYQMDFIK